MSTVYQKMESETFGVLVQWICFSLTTIIWVLLYFHFHVFTRLSSQARALVVLRIKVPEFQFHFSSRRKSSRIVNVNKWDCSMSATAVILPPRLNTMTLWAKSNGEVQVWVLSVKQGGTSCLVFAMTYLCAASNKLAAQHRLRLLQMYFSATYWRDLTVFVAKLIK